MKKTNKVYYFIANVHGVQPMLWKDTNYQQYQKLCDNLFDSEDKAIEIFKTRQEKARMFQLRDRYYLITKQLEVIECSWHNTLPEYNAVCRNEVFLDKDLAFSQAIYRQQILQYLK